MADAIADELVWELPYAPAIGHPARLSRRKEVVGFVTWFLAAVEHFRFFDLKVCAVADPEADCWERRRRDHPDFTPLGSHCCHWGELERSFHVSKAATSRIPYT